MNGDAGDRKRMRNRKPETGNGKLEPANFTRLGPRLTGFPFAVSGFRFLISLDTRSSQGNRQSRQGEGVWARAVAEIFRAVGPRGVGPR